MNDFIGIYENAFSQKYCDSVIKQFNSMEVNGFTHSRQQLGKKTINMDDSCLFHQQHQEINLAPTGLLPDFNTGFWDKYKEYADKYSILQQAEDHSNYCFKVQKTDVGGGYHTWHCEIDSRENCHRLLVWMVYLNDVEEGGETEFLYQHKRVKPKTGTLVIWPAGFTHTHRGNPPLSNSKYIITGWIEF